MENPSQKLERRQKKNITRLKLMENPPKKYYDRTDRQEEKILEKIDFLFSFRLHVYG